VNRPRLAQGGSKHSNIFLIFGEIEFGELSTVDRLRKEWGFCLVCYAGGKNEKCINR
jgi:hypothetical protein